MYLMFVVTNVSHYSHTASRVPGQQVLVVGHDDELAGEAVDVRGRPEDAADLGLRERVRGAWQNRRDDEGRVVFARVIPGLLVLLRTGHDPVWQPGRLAERDVSVAGQRRRGAEPVAAQPVAQVVRSQ